MQTCTPRLKGQMNLFHEHAAQMITVLLLSVRLRPSIVCGMVSVGIPKRSLERSTTATTLVLPNRYSLRVMAFSRYKNFLYIYIYACASQLFSSYFAPWKKKFQRNIPWFVFACRSFVLDMITVTEASAVMSTSCEPSKGVSSCPFSSCLGMQLDCNDLMKHLSCSLDGHYCSLSEFLSD